MGGGYDVHTCCMVDTADCHVCVFACAVLQRSRDKNRAVNKDNRISRDIRGDIARAERLAAMADEQSAWVRRTDNEEEVRCAPCSVCHAPWPPFRCLLLCSCVSKCVRVF